MTGERNDWERRYHAAVACPACGRADVHAADCTVFRRDSRKLKRVAAAIVVVVFVIAIWQGSVGGFVTSLIGVTIGCSIAWFFVRRAQRREER